MVDAKKKALPLVIFIIYMMAYIALTMIIKEDKSADYIYAAPPFRMIDFCLGILLYRFYRSERGNKFMRSSLPNLVHGRHI